MPCAPTAPARRGRGARQQGPVERGSRAYHVQHPLRTHDCGPSLLYLHPASTTTLHQCDPATASATFDCASWQALLLLQAIPGVRTYAGRAERCVRFRRRFRRSSGAPASRCAVPRRACLRRRPHHLRPLLLLAVVPGATRRPLELPVVTAAVAAVAHARRTAAAIGPRPTVRAAPMLHRCSGRRGSVPPRRLPRSTTVAAAVVPRHPHLRGAVRRAVRRPMHAVVRAAVSLAATLVTGRASSSRMRVPGRRLCQVASRRRRPGRHPGLL